MPLFLHGELAHSFISENDRKHDFLAAAVVRFIKQANLS